MNLLLLGDLHGNWRRVYEIISREMPQGGVLLCVGDLETYAALPAGCTMYFTPGNREQWKILETLEQPSSPLNHLHPIRPGKIVRLADSLRLAGLAGNFSPAWYEKDALSGERRRHFTRCEVESLLALGANQVDLFLSHEAPQGVGFRKYGQDLGKPQITEILQTLQPRLAFFGHHHLFFDGSWNAMRIIGLEEICDGYGLLETTTWSFRHVVG